MMSIVDPARATEIAKLITTPEQSVETVNGKIAPSWWHGDQDASDASLMAARALGGILSKEVNV
jgi:hypothetical protein